MYRANNPRHTLIRSLTNTPLYYFTTFFRFRPPGDWVSGLSFYRTRRCRSHTLPRRFSKLDRSTANRVPIPNGTSLESSRRHVFQRQRVRHRHHSNCGGIDHGKNRLGGGDNTPSYSGTTIPRLKVVGWGYCASWVRALRSTHPMLVETPALSHTLGYQRCRNPRAIHTLGYQQCRTPRVKSYSGVPAVSKTPC